LPVIVKDEKHSFLTTGNVSHVKDYDKYLVDKKQTNNNNKDLVSLDFISFINNPVNSNKIAEIILKSPNFTNIFKQLKGNYVNINITIDDLE
jgi:tRNA U34 5-methylaminomethyl-2-thiouridine-forming methyltransferase MnmC